MANQGSTESGLQNPEYLASPEELAKFLKVPLGWVYEKARRGSRVKPMPTIRAGRYLRFHIPTVMNWLEETGGIAPRETEGLRDGNLVKLRK